MISRLILISILFSSQAFALSQEVSTESSAMQANIKVTFGEKDCRQNANQLVCVFNLASLPKGSRILVSNKNPENMVVNFNHEKKTGRVSFLGEQKSILESIKRGELSANLIYQGQ